MGELRSTGRSRLVSIFAAVVVLAAVAGSLISLIVRGALHFLPVVMADGVSVAERGVNRNDTAGHAHSFGSSPSSCSG